MQLAETHYRYKEIRNGKLLYSFRYFDKRKK